MLPMTLLLIKEAAVRRRGANRGQLRHGGGAVREGWDDAGVALRGGMTAAVAVCTSHHNPRKTKAA